jgi:catechol 2,3-dioxygenase-like lactoylglutathione lyase family enzyme
VVEGVSKVVIEVDDQARAREFWTETLGFELHQDTPYGWWSMFKDQEGNRFALRPREAT